MAALTPDTVSDAISWGVGLAVALALIWASWTLQRLREQATRRATEAEETSAVSRELHELAAALASAATPSEVAGALLSRVPDLLGSVGGSLGLVEGDELVIVDPEGPQPALEPGLRLPLTTTAPITVAARTGAPAHASPATSSPTSSRTAHASRRTRNRHSPCRYGSRAASPARSGSRSRV